MSPRLQLGQPAPVLDLLNQDRRPVTLADLRGQRVIVYFFPKAFTPGCTTELCDFRDRQPALQTAGYTVLGVSADDPDRLAEFRSANHTHHDLLSDPDGTAARLWGAFGPKVVNGQQTEGILRSTFVIDTEGLVTSADYEVDATDHVSQLSIQLGV
ncbi:MAG: peroxiredoxin [Propionibacteriaceae bacterium]